jgi:hypothetical protein
MCEGVCVRVNWYVCVNCKRASDNPAKQKSDKLDILSFPISWRIYVRTACCHLCAQRFKGQGRFKDQGRFKGQVCEISTHPSFTLMSPHCSRCLLCPFHFGFVFVFLGYRCNVVASKHPPRLFLVASQPSRAPASLISSSAAAV